MIIHHLRDWYHEATLLALSAYIGEDGHHSSLFTFTHYCGCDGDLGTHTGGCPPNFAHHPSGLRVSWYKRIGRGMEANRAVDREEWLDILAECLRETADQRLPRPFDGTPAETEAIVRHLIDLDNQPPQQEPPFETALQQLINRHCIDTVTDTPDFVLAHYLMSCLGNFEATTRGRGEWFGHTCKVGACRHGRKD